MHCPVQQSRTTCLDTFAVGMQTPCDVLMTDSQLPESLSCRHVDLQVCNHGLSGTWLVP